MADSSLISTVGSISGESGAQRQHSTKTTSYFVARNASWYICPLVYSVQSTECMQYKVIVLHGLKGIETSTVIIKSITT